MEKENGIVEFQERRIGSSELQTNAKKVTSLDINDEKQQDMLLSAMTKADCYLKDCVGQVIDCVGYYIYQKETQEISEETGEEYTKYSHSLILFDKDGKSYVTGSNSCYHSFRNIIDIKGLPSFEKPLKLEVINIDAEEKGHKYLKVSIVKNK